MFTKVSNIKPSVCVFTANDDLTYTCTGYAIATLEVTEKQQLCLIWINASDNFLNGS